MTYRSRSSKDVSPVISLPKWTAPAIEPFKSPLEHLETLIQRIGSLVTAHAARMPEDRRFRDSDRMNYLIEASSFASGECPDLSRALWKTADGMLQWIRAREQITTIELPFLRLVTTFQLSEPSRMC